ncbi:MAG: ornithine carbamoyltransferase [Thermoleophilaceae bacterium]|nr:ornithine carbamoyltransferase [Thermoleophilaceae bacterium]
MAIHFLTGAELTASELHALLARAAELKASRNAPATAPGPLAGKSVALLFERPSTRTRLSSEVGVSELGGHPVVLSGAEMQLSRGESVRDTALVMSRFVHAIGVRTGAHSIVEELALQGSVPIINLLTEDHHPCQALADLLTMRERFGELAGKKLAYVGDGNNVAASLMLLGAKAGVTVACATPPQFAPDPAIVALAQEQIEGNAEIIITDDPAKAVAGAHAVYTDVWVSMGDNDSDLRKAALGPYQLNEQLLAQADPAAIALHCLPAHVGEEITEDALYGRRSAIFDQAENRLHVFKALLEHLMT